MQGVKTKKIFQFFILAILLLGGLLFCEKTDASIKKEFNYQGKLTDSNGLAVPDGAYDVVFKIYSQAGGGTAWWTESWVSSSLFTDSGTTLTADGCSSGVDQISYTSDTNESSLKVGQNLWNTTKAQSAVIESINTSSNYICVYSPASTWEDGDEVTNMIYVKSGLFSAMVGSITSLSLNFSSDTYYLGVTIGSDSEMIPRKKMGSVPQAWTANNISGDGFIDIDNTSTSQDAANINYNPTSGSYNALSVIYGSGGGTGTALSISQSGTGNIVDVKDGSTSVFIISDGGNVTINANLDVNGNIEANKINISSYSKYTNGGNYPFYGAFGGPTIEEYPTLNDFVGNQLMFADAKGYTISSSGSITNVTNSFRQGDTYSTITNTTLPIVVTVEGAINSDTSVTAHRLFLQAHGTMTGHLVAEVKINDDSWVTVADEDINLSSKEYWFSQAITNVAPYPDSWNLKGARFSLTSLTQSTSYIRQLGYYKRNGFTYQFLSEYNPVFYGRISGPTGSAAAPSYTWTGDYDTGTFSPSSDAFGISTGGTERFRIDSSGYVGIGTTSPSARLDVAQNSTDSALSVAQSGTGKIVDFKDGSTSVFAISDGGSVEMNALTFKQNAVNPVLKGVLSDSTNMDSANGIYVSGKYAYVTGYDSDSLAIVDISNPSAPTLVGSLIDSTNMYGATSVYVSGNYAYVAGYEGDSLAIVDISNPSNLTLLGSIFDSEDVWLGFPSDVYVSGKYAYVACSAGDNLSVIDISDPTNPVFVSYLETGASSSAIYVSGNYAYVVNVGDSSFDIVDISNPTNLTIVGTYTDSTNMGNPLSIYISGRYAYVASFASDSLTVVDISDPTSPTLASSLIDLTNLTGASTIYVSGDYAYITSYGNSSLTVVDISDPNAPSVTGSLIDTTNFNNTYDIYVSGKYAYVSSYFNDSLAVVDISGFDIPTANIGDLNVSTIDVTENANIANDLYVGNGLNVGSGGIFSGGPLAGYVNSSVAALTISQNGIGDLVDLKNSGTSVFKISQTAIEISAPLDLQVEGDVGIEYNLEFMNTSTSYINSVGPLTISAGDNHSYENLTLTTSGTGDVIVDIASSSVGFKIIGTSTKVFSVDGSGNVIIGGVDSNDADLTVKGDIETQGGNLNLNNLSTPSGVAISNLGTSGSTTYGYRISAINGNGETVASATTETTTGNATLDSTNYNRITWSAVTGATGYKIYGRTSGSELYMATVDSPTLHYFDDGTVTTPTGDLPTINTTGGTINYPSSDGPIRSLILTPSGATVPTSNGASQVKVDGTNHTYYVLDFDDSSDESSYWHWTMPDSYDGDTIDVTYYWETAATTGDAIWCFQAIGIESNNSEDIDSALASAVCEIDTAQANANDLASVTESMATSNFAAGDYVAFKIYRDADDASDTLTGDARLVKVKVEYHVSSESD